MDPLAQDREHWLASVDTVLTARFPLKNDERFDYLNNYLRCQKDGIVSIIIKISL
jgi:hypothetical protein